MTSLYFLSTKDHRLIVTINLFLNLESQTNGNDLASLVLPTFK